MKKVIFSAMAVGLCFAGGAAYGAPSEEHDEKTANEEHLAYDGIYFCFGLSANDSSERNEYTYGQYLTNIELSNALVNSFNTEAGDRAEAIVAAVPGVGPAEIAAARAAAATYTTNTFTNQPSGVWNGTTDKEIDHHSTRFGGTAVIGIGRKIGATKSFYIGVEGGVDIARPTSYSRLDVAGGGGSRYYSVEVGRKSVTPWIAARVGGIDCGTNMLFYGKVGMSHAESTQSYEEYIYHTTNPGAGKSVVFSKHKVSAFAPIFAAGVEKTFGKRGTIRVEAEYRLSENKTKQFGENHGSVKLTQEASFTARVLLCSHLRLFDRFVR
jgi:hypothetical protein